MKAFVLSAAVLVLATAAAAAPKPLDLRLVVDCAPGAPTVPYAHQGVNEGLCLAPDIIVGRADIKDAQVITTGYGDEAARLTISDEAVGRLTAATSANVGKRIAVVYDGHVIFAPVVRDPITGNQLEITVGSTGDSVEDFVADLNGPPTP